MSKTRRDGTTVVACPQCGAEYRIPANQIDLHLQCRNCPRLFFPKASGRRGARKQGDARPFIYGGAILLFVVVVFVIVANSGRGPEIGPAPVSSTAGPPTGMDNPRVRDVHGWVTAIAEGNRFKLRNLSDILALQKKLGIATEGLATDALGDLVVERLVTGDETLLFRKFEATSARVPEVADAERAEGTVRVHLAVRDEFRKQYQGAAEFAVSYKFAGDRAKVTGWDMIQAPIEMKPREKGHTPHKDIGPISIVERSFGNEMVKVAEADLVPLGHLDGISDDLKREIDQLIDKLIDIEGRGNVVFHSIRRLQEIGRPSIPRLLNKMYEIPLDDQDNVLRMRRVTQALNQITGQRFGFNPSVVKDAQTASTDADRISTLKQWYAWWATYHDQPYDFAIDKGETLDDIAPEAPAKRPTDPKK